MTTEVMEIGIPGIRRLDWESDAQFIARWPDALDALVRQLRINGWLVYNNRHQPFNAQVHPPKDVYAIYPTHIKCEGCGGYVHRLDRALLPTFDETCDKCDAVIYRHLDEDAIVRFHLGKLPYVDQGLTARVKYWKPTTGELFLKWKQMQLAPKAGRVPTPGATYAYLAAHRDRWDTIIDEDGEPLLVVRYGAPAGNDFPDVHISQVVERERFTWVARRKVNVPDGEKIVARIIEIPAVTLPVSMVISITTSY